jgi:hypothetical protein
MAILRKSRFKTVERAATASDARQTVAQSLRSRRESSRRSQGFGSQEPPPHVRESACLALVRAAFHAQRIHNVWCPSNPAPIRPTTVKRKMTTLQSMRSRAIRHAVSLSCVAALAFAPFTFGSRAALADDDADVPRLNSATNVLKWNYVPSGKTERYGHAEVLINAPLAKVRQLVTDYAHYKELAPTKFQNSRVVAKRAGETDVYLQIPIMNGLVTLWDVARFSPPRVASPGVEIIEGHQIKGNLKDFQVAWTLRSLGDNTTVLKCDLLLLLNIAAPQTAVDEELRDAAGQAVDAIWGKAQNGQRKIVPFNGTPTSKSIPGSPLPP